MLTMLMLINSTQDWTNCGKIRERSGFSSDFGPARSVWTGDRTDSIMTDRVQSNPLIDIRPIDSNIDSIVARQFATSRPLGDSDSGRIEVAWGSDRPRHQRLV